MSVSNPVDDIEPADHQRVLELSARGAASRRKGNRAEQVVVNYLRSEGWIDARRYLAGDGRQPGDIDWHPLVCLEVKDVVQSTWPTWCRQAAAEAREGMVPAVVRKTAPLNRPGDWECRWRAWPPLAPRRSQTGLVDGEVWYSATLADLVALVRAVDA